MTKRALQLFLGILLVTLGFSTSANAGNMKIAFTVFVEGNTTPIDFGDEYSTIKLRMTEKDVLAWLDEVGIYSVPDGASLFFTGTYLRILNADGDIVETVDTAYIEFSGSASAIGQGIWGFLLGDKNKITSRREEYFDLNFDSGNFWNLTGFSEDKVDQNAGFLNHNYKATLIGGGEIDNRQCIVFGTLKIKYATAVL